MTPHPFSIVSWLSAAQPLNTWFPISVMPLPNTADFKLEQPINALAPRWLTVAGMAMDSRLEQFWKLLLPTDKSPLFSLTLLKLVQPRKADAWMVVTELGKSMLVRLMQFSKAPEPVPPSLLPPIT